MEKQMMKMRRKQAVQAKDAGNAAFEAQSFAKAIQHYTEAITNDPTDAVFFSNRSGAYASLHQYAEALSDAEECVRLRPVWWKGYSRKGMALFKLDRLEESEATFTTGLTFAPDEQSMKDGLAQIKLALAVGWQR